MKDPYANLRKFQNRDMEGDMGPANPPEGRLYMKPQGGVQKLDIRPGDAGHSGAMKFYKSAKNKGK